MGCKKEVSEAGKKKCNILKIQYKRIPCSQHSMNISGQNTLTRPSMNCGVCNFSQGGSKQPCPNTKITSWSSRTWKVSSI
ncbi:hypothetical protein NC652_008947 [Populus alba x Populus x berolinensis]|nr:hypothetical protein NC652_008947 [Populus alba x Populus x berolinensis]